LTFFLKTVSIGTQQKSSWNTKQPTKERLTINVMNPIIKKISLTILVAALAGGTLMAQTKAPKVQQPGRVITLPHFPSVQIPLREDNSDSPDVNITIAKNLGPTGNLYVIDNGWLVTGSADPTFGGPFSVGIQFRPSVTCHAKTLQAAITYFEGTKNLRLGIYTSSAGAVGTLIQDGATTAIPNFGTCCTLAKVTLSGLGAALTAGTDYFLVATAGSTDEALVWDFLPPVNGGANGQSFSSDGVTYDAEWTYYGAYQIKGTNP
jgi:hypothetical protein